MHVTGIYTAHLIGMVGVPCTGNGGDEYSQLSPSGKTGCGESLKYLLPQEVKFYLFISKTFTALLKEK